MTSSAGEIIYKAFAPNLKIWICIAIGFIVTKKGLFPPASAKGVSTLSLNVGLPCLVFSSMVTALSPENGSSFGGLIFTAVAYEAVGMGLAWVLRELVYVPQDFRWGILVLGAISNWGNLPVAIVQTLGLSPPFDGSHDIQLGTAYASIYILVMNVCLFPCGLHKLCAFDFKEKNLSRPAPEPLISRLSTMYTSYRRRQARTLEDEEKRNHQSTNSADTAVMENEAAEAQEQQLEKTISPGSGSDDHGEHGEEPTELKKRVGSQVRYGGGSLPTRKKSRASSFTSMMESTRSIPATAPLDAVDLTTPCHLTSSRVTNTSGPETGEAADPARSPQLDPTEPGVIRICSNHGPDYTYHQPATPAPSIHRISWGKRLLKFLRGFIMPVTIAIFLAVPCSLVLPLKALFTPVDGWTGTRIPNAPNGEPPLGFILQTTLFLGGMSVPTSLILLGSSFARLKAPERLTSLPIAAVVLMTCIKMIFIPIFSIFVVQALRDGTSLFPKDDRMRSFVAIISSGTPAAINQLVLTQLYNPAGTAHTLALFLSLQYLVMPILTTAIAAIALYIVE